MFYNISGGLTCRSAVTPFQFGGQIFDAISFLGKKDDEVV